MKSWSRRLAPLLVIVLALLTGKMLIAGREAPERSRPPAPLPLVEVAALERGDYRIMLDSRGVVEPAVEGSLVAQVAGVIVETASGFTDGGFFEAGEVLVRIDPRDYRSAVRIAEAERVQAELQLAEESARAAQAERDWARLESSEPPSELALRKPQLANARAALAAAEARLAQARLDLERTQVRAPWAGRVRTQEVDIGQFVAAGSVLANIFASDFAEVRLPLTSRQLARLDVPRSVRGAELPSGKGPLVTLIDQSGGQSIEWQGRVVRDEGTVDPASRQSFVIARVDDPYGRHADGRAPLRVGQFVEARIEGRLLHDVIAIPRSAVREADTVYLVDADDRLQPWQPEILWRDGSKVVVRGEPAAGSRVVTSALALASPGMQVRVGSRGGAQDKDPAP